MRNTIRILRILTVQRTPLVFAYPSLPGTVDVEPKVLSERGNRVIDRLSKDDPISKIFEQKTTTDV